MRDPITDYGGDDNNECDCVGVTERLNARFMGSGGEKLTVLGMDIGAGVGWSGAMGECMVGCHG